jgi:hypothetical protein
MPDYEAMSDREFAAAIRGEHRRDRERFDDLIEAYGVIGVPGVEAEARAFARADGHIFRTVVR